MYLSENLIKGIDGKFLSLLHGISPKKPPLSGRRRF
jgi:hypothetical protein